MQVTDLERTREHLLADLDTIEDLIDRARTAEELSARAARTTRLRRAACARRNAKRQVLAKAARATQREQAEQRARAVKTLTRRLAAVVAIASTLDGHEISAAAVLSKTKRAHLSRARAVIVYLLGCMGVTILETAEALGRSYHAAYCVRRRHLSADEWVLLDAVFHLLP